MLAVIPVRPISNYTRSEGSSLEYMDTRQGFPKVPVFPSSPPKKEKVGTRYCTLSGINRSCTNDHWWNALALPECSRKGTPVMLSAAKHLAAQQPDPSLRSGKARREGSMTRGDA